MIGKGHDALHALECGSLAGWVTGSRGPLVVDVRGTDWGGQGGRETQVVSLPCEDWDERPAQKW